MKKTNKRNIITFTIIFIITCIIFIPFLVGHYATDTYNITNIGYKEYAIKWSLKDGRVFMTIIALLANVVSMPIEAYTFITLFIALIISNISVITLKNIIEKYKKPQNWIQEATLTTISYITIFNFMYLENMYFVESIAMAISVLLFMISANIIVEKNRNYIVKSLMLTILGVLCYQGTIGMIFAFTMLFTILKNKNNAKQMLFDLIKCGVIALIAVFINIIVVKIVGNCLNIKQNRLGKSSNILNNINRIIITLPYILKSTCNLFPKNMFLIFLSILTIILVIYHERYSEEKDCILYKYILIITMAIAASCITYILTLTSFYTGRLRNSLGALIGIIFIFLFVETSIFEKDAKAKVLKVSTYIILIFFVLTNIINYEYIMLKHRSVNMIEKQQAQEIGEYIKRYERDTGINVTKIIKLPPANIVYGEDENDITRNALKTNWAVDGVINFYTKKNLETVNLTEENAKKYKENGNNQLEYQCIDDVFYIKIYCF